MITIFVTAWTVDAALRDCLAGLKELQGIAQIPKFEVLVALDPALGKAGAAGELEAWPFPVKTFSAPRSWGTGAAFKQAIPLFADRVFFIPIVHEATKSLVRQCLIHDSDADVVLGFPVNLEARHLLRNVGTFLFRMVYLFSFGTALNCINSMGIYPKAIVQALPLRGDKFSLLSELNTRILRSHCTYCEVPFYTFNDRRAWRTLSLFDLVDLLRSFFSMVVEFRRTGEAAPIGPDHPAVYRRLPIRQRFSDAAEAARMPASKGIISFVIPVLNEGQNIALTCDTIRNVCLGFPWIEYEIVIVNDGSIDSTGSISDALAVQYTGKIRVLHHTYNQGIGNSVKDGMKTARGDRFVFLPGDNQASANLVVSLLQFDGLADVVFSYPANLGTRGVLRNLISQLYIMIFTVLCGNCLNYVNAVGIYPIEAVKAACVRGNRFSFIAEMNIKMIRSGRTFIEVPSFGNIAADANRRVWRTISPRNIAEAGRGLARLLADLWWSRRAMFRHPPHRLVVDLDGGNPPVAVAGAQTGE